MTLQQTINALDLLNTSEYNDIREYIQSFNGNHGFMYTVEADPSRIALQKHMEKVLDDGSHSIASWGFMLRTIQAVYNGIISYEDILSEKEKHDENNRIWSEERYQKIKEQEEENNIIPVEVTE